MDTTDLLIRHIDAGLGGVHERLDRIEERLESVEAQTKKTNGRVNGLESRETAAEAVRSDRAAHLVEERENRDRRVSTRLALYAAGCSLGGSTLGALVALILSH